MSTLVVNELNAAREAEYRIRMPSNAHLNISGTLSIDNTAVATKQKELLEEVKKIEETKVAKKASAKAKLKSLGLDDAEISALIGE